MSLAEAESEIEHLNHPYEPQGDADDDEWDLVIQPKRHLLDINLRAIWEYRDLLYMFVKRDIVTVYKQTVLGPVWFFVQPIMTMLVYVLVFGNIAKISTDGIPGPLFYLSGIVMWNFFNESFSKTSVTFKENAQIFGKVYFPRLIVPLSVIVSGMVKFLIQFGLFFAVYVYFLCASEAVHPTTSLALVPYMVLLMAGLGLGFGIIFSSLTTKYRDLTFVIQFGVQLLMYATPIIYPMSTVNERIRSFLWWNPLAHLIEGFKHAFLGAGQLSLAGLAYATLFTVATLFIGVLVFNRTEQTFMDTV
ncbi:MAG: ABC transporter permease [Candidatus Paceibacterota bacterium]